MSVTTQIETLYSTVDNTETTLYTADESALEYQIIDITLGMNFSNESTNVDIYVESSGNIYYILYNYELNGTTADYGIASKELVGLNLNIKDKILSENDVVKALINQSTDITICLTIAKKFES